MTETVATKQVPTEAVLVSSTYLVECYQSTLRRLLEGYRTPGKTVKNFALGMGGLRSFLRLLAMELSANHGQAEDAPR
jgi:hypothetical protein